MWQVKVYYRGPDGSTYGRGRTITDERAAEISGIAQQLWMEMECTNANRRNKEKEDEEQD